MRRFLIVFSAVGVLVFGSAFALSFLAPILIESAAREVVRMEIERRVGERIESLSNARLVTIAQRAAGKTEQEIEATRRALQEEVPRKVAKAIADMLNADCACRKRLDDIATATGNARLEGLIQLREKLTAFIESTYASVTAQLMREFRIFTGTNAMALALLGAISYARRGAALQLALPAVVLVGAVLITSSTYLFQQDWLRTIIFSQYVGLAYMGYLAAVAALLADVVINRARITSQLINVASSAVGSAIRAIPC